MKEFWKHKCIERIYRVEHGEIYLHNDVKICSICGVKNDR